MRFRGMLFLLVFLMGCTASQTTSQPGPERPTPTEAAGTMRADSAPETDEPRHENAFRKQPPLREVFVLTITNQHDAPMRLEEADAFFIRYYLTVPQTILFRLQVVDLANNRIISDMNYMREICDGYEDGIRCSPAIEIEPGQERRFSVRACVMHADPGLIEPIGMRVSRLNAKFVNPVVMQVR